MAGVAVGGPGPDNLSNTSKKNRAVNAHGAVLFVLLLRQSSLQGLHPVGLLPGHAQVLPAHVAIGGQLAVDGAAQVQIPDDGGGTQVTSRR